MELVQTLPNQNHFDSIIIYYIILICFIRNTFYLLININYNTTTLGLTTNFYLVFKLKTILDTQTNLRSRGEKKAPETKRLFRSVRYFFFGVIRVIVCSYESVRTKFYHCSLARPRSVAGVTVKS